MPSPQLIKTVLREMFTGERSGRVTEPDLVMDNPAHVEQYVAAGRENAVMAPVYLFHCANICDVIRPGDTVLDLACGPANQLAMVARLNPETNFVGVDLSDEMLDAARALVAEQGLKNVRFVRHDISDLSMFADQSIDAVMSTMALHHLPDLHTLKRTYAEVHRVLKADGGIYMVDFGHLKSPRSIDYFANQYAHRQGPHFTLDYFNSLHAAFYPDDFREAARPLLGRAKLHKTIGLPFMVALKTPARRGHDPALKATLASMKQGLPDWHRGDYSDLIRHFKLGGMHTHSIA
jgi:SAM-dependent methyltransferase